MKQVEIASQASAKLTNGIGRYLNGENVVNDKVEVVSIPFNQFGHVIRRVFCTTFGAITSDEKPPDVDRIIFAAPLQMRNTFSLKKLLYIFI